MLVETPTGQSRPEKAPGAAPARLRRDRFQSHRCALHHGREDRYCCESRVRCPCGLRWLGATLNGGDHHPRQPKPRPKTRIRIGSPRVSRRNCCLQPIQARPPSTEQRRFGSNHEKKWVGGEAFAGSMISRNHGYSITHSALPYSVSVLKLWTWPNWRQKRAGFLNSVRVCSWSGRRHAT